MNPSFDDQAATRDERAEARALAREVPTGKRLGRYPVLSVLGAGGMGEVLRVLDPEVGRDVAAKVMRGQADATTLAKFIREAQLTGCLEHPSIVPLYEMGSTEDGQAYFTMKRVDGKDLAEVIEDLRQGQGPTLIELLQIFGKICEAIAFAHDRHVIHRDLKPANVMVGAFGEVLVMDWGLAKRLDGADGPDLVADRLAPAPRGAADSGPLATRDGAVMGTPAYMPPEQAGGEIDRVGPRSDVYSLGAILYELLALQPPHQGATGWAVLANVIEGAFPAPTERAPADRPVPWELEQVVLKAMAFDPNDRYQTVGALARDVRAFIEGRALAAASYSSWQLLGKWAARNRPAIIAGAIAAAVGVASLTSAFLGISFQRDEALKAQAIADERRQQAVEARGEADRHRDAARGAKAAMRVERDAAVDARRHAEALLGAALAQRALAEGLESDAALLATRALARRELPAARSTLWAALRKVPTCTDIISCQASTWSADRRWLAVLAGRGVVRVWDASRWELARELIVPDDALRLRFDPTSQRLIAISRDSPARSWAVRSWQAGPELAALRGNLARCRSLTFSGDGRIAAFHDGFAGRIVVLNLVTGAKLHDQPAGPQVVLALDARGRQLFIRDKTTRLRDLQRGTVARLVGGNSQYSQQALFSSDGTRVLQSTERALLLWDLQKRRQIASVPVRRWLHARRHGWVDDQHFVCWTAAGAELRRASDGALVRQLAKGPDRCFASVSVAHKRLLTGHRGGSLRVWDLASGNLLALLRGHPGGVVDAELDQQGRRLISIDESGDTRVWDIASGRRLASLRGGQWTAVGFAPGPDGQPIIADHGEGRVTRWRLSNATGPRELKGDLELPAWMPIGQGARLLLSAGTGGALVQIDLTEGRGGFAGPSLSVQGTPTRPPRARFLPDGRVLAASSQERQAAVSLDGEITWLEGSSQDALRWGPAGKWAARPQGDRVHLWDVSTGARLPDLAHPATVLATAFSPDGALLATASGDGNLRVWRLSERRCVQTHASPIRRPQDKHALTVARGGRFLHRAGSRLEVRELVSGKRLLAGDYAYASMARLSPDGRQLGLIGVKGRLRLVDVDSGRELTLEGCLPHRITWTFSADGRQLTCALKDGRVAMIRDGQVRFARLSARVTELVCSRDGGVVAAAVAGDEVHVLRVDGLLLGKRRGRDLLLSADGAWLATYDGRLRGRVVVSAVGPKALGPGRRLPGSHDDAELVPGGKGILLWSGSSCRLATFPEGQRVRDLRWAGFSERLAGDRLVGPARRYGTQILSASKPPLVLDRALVAPPKVAVSRAGDRFVSAVSGSSRAVLRTLPEGRVIAELELSDPSSTPRVAFSRDGVLAIAAGATTQLWTRDGEPLATLAAHTARVRVVAFSPDGRLLATGSSDETARLWDVPSGRCRAVLEGHGRGVQHLAWRADGRLLLTAPSKGAVRTWTPDGTLKATLAISESHRFPPRFVAGGLLARESEQAMALWDPESGRRLETLAGHTEELLCLAVDPLGALAVTGADDQTVRIWDLRQGRQLCLLQQDTLVRDVAFSASGGHVITSYEGRIRVHEIGALKRDPRRLEALTRLRSAQAIAGWVVIEEPSLPTPPALAGLELAPSEAWRRALSADDPDVDQVASGLLQSDRPARAWLGLASWLLSRSRGRTRMLLLLERLERSPRLDARLQLALAVSRSSPSWSGLGRAGNAPSAELSRALALARSSAPDHPLVTAVAAHLGKP